MPAHKMTGVQKDNTVEDAGEQVSALQLLNGASMYAQGTSLLPMITPPIPTHCLLCYVGPGPLQP